MQSQFRFDNECYLNLPDNHKRVSNSAANSDESASYSTNPICGDLVDQTNDFTSSIDQLNAFMPSVVALQAVNSATTNVSSNIVNANNVAIDEHSFASVSMLFI